MADIWKKRRKRRKTIRGFKASAEGFKPRLSLRTRSKFAMMASKRRYLSRVTRRKFTSEG